MSDIAPSGSSQNPLPPAPEDGQVPANQQNPWNPQTQPAQYSQWEQDRAALGKTDAERRQELLSAQREDAGLHPQDGVNVNAPGQIPVQTGTGNTSTVAAQRSGAAGGPTRVLRNESGETPAEAFRRQLAGQPAQGQDLVVDQTDDVTRPQGSVQIDSPGNVIGPDRVTSTGGSQPEGFPLSPADPQGATPRETTPSDVTEDQAETAEPATTVASPLTPPASAPDSLQPDGGAANAFRADDGGGIDQGVAAAETDPLISEQAHAEASGQVAPPETPTGNAPDAFTSEWPPLSERVPEQPVEPSPAPAQETPDADESH